MARVVIAGVQHETNTFCRRPTTWTDFAEAADRPAVPEGRRLIDVFSGMQEAVSGAIEGLRNLGHEIVPTVWASATPGGIVTADAFERLCSKIQKGFRGDGVVDAVYLDLHGAMVAEGYDDGDAEILRRMRASIGDRVPIVVSLDFHANTSPEMFRLADYMVGYRTYPHVDMRETGRRAVVLLDRILRTKSAPAKAYRQLPFLIPLNAQCTLDHPLNLVFRRIEAVEPFPGAVTFTPGFASADVEFCGPALMAFADRQQEADRLIADLSNLIEQHEADFSMQLFSPDEAVLEAVASYRGKPIVLADTQDNPGVGGTSDTVGLLRALLHSTAVRSVLGVFCDPAAVARACEAGVEGNVELELGGRNGLEGEEPVRRIFHVDALGTGDVTCTGPMWGGSLMKLGPMALLSSDNLKIVAAGRRVQAGDQALFHHLGVDLRQQQIIALKSSVNFRADFDRIAERVITVEAPGAMCVNPLKLRFEKLRPGVRLAPGCSDRVSGRVD